MAEKRFLGFDIGGTKTAWGLFGDRLFLIEEGRFETPHNEEELVRQLISLIEKHQPLAVGIGIAGTHTRDRQQLLVCPNLPFMNGVRLPEVLQEAFPEVVISMDNDARCALIGEVIAGVAMDHSSAVMLTLGTGVGGAVMQKRIVQPHPESIDEEIGHIVVDSTDGLNTPNGRGTIEALIGGKNLESRFGIDMKSLAKGARVGNNEALQVWEQIAHYFSECLTMVHATYNCKLIVIGGIGSRDLEYYLQTEPPCEVVVAKHGEQAGVYGAAQIGIDAWHDKEHPEWV